jgi:hypothetical protein
MVSHQRPLSITYDILSLINSIILTANMILLCTKKKNLCLILDSYSSFYRKMHIRLLVWCHLCPIWLPLLPLNLTFILIFLRHPPERTCPI